MKKIVFLMMCIVSLLVGGARANEFESPYSDVSPFVGNLTSLLHFNEAVTIGGYLYVEDDDSENTVRNANSGLYEGVGVASVQVSTGGPAIVDPSGTVGYPAVNAAFANVAYLDGVDDSFRIPASKFALMDSSNMKVDFWARPGDTQIDQAVVNDLNVIVDRWGQLVISCNSSGDGTKWKFNVIQWDGNNAVKYLSSAWYSASEIKNWFHVSYQNYKGETALSVNGQSVSTVTLDTEALYTHTRPFTYIGCRYNSLQNFDGYLDELRFGQVVDVPPVLPEFMSPYTDLIGYNMLLHCDVPADGNDVGYEAALDDDSDNPGRDNDMIKYTATTATPIGGSAGPALVTPDDYPANNPAFDKCYYFGGALTGEHFRLDDDNDTGNENENLVIDPMNVRIEAWVKIDEEEIYQSEGTSYDYYIFNRHGQIRVTITDVGTNLGINSWRIGFTAFAENGNHYYPAYYYGTNIDASPFEWHHVALEIFGSSIKFLVNGVVLTDRDFNNSDVLKKEPSSQMTRLGAYGSASKYFCGWIDETRVGPAEWVEPECGGWGYSPADFNEDCSVDLLDYAEMFNEWLQIYEDSGADVAEIRNVPLTGNYNVPQATITPVLDGTISQGEWYDAKPIELVYPNLIENGNVGTLSRLVGDLPTPEDFSLFWYLKWDSGYLYAAARIYDDSFAAPMGSDEPQLGFNLFDDPDAAFLSEALLWNLPVNGSINVNGGLVYSNSAVAGSEVAGGYIIEFKLAWSDLNSINGGSLYVPQINDVHGFSLNCQDHDGESYERECMLADYGSGTWTVNQPATWNTVTLVNALSCGDLGYMESDFNQDCLVNIDDLDVVVADWLGCSDPFVDGCEDFRL